MSKPPVWKKPRTKVYDYNYNLGEHYYKPQLRHMENKYGSNRGSSPPRARTFAERFAEDPVYGNNSPYNYRTTDDAAPAPPPPRRTSLQEDDFAPRTGLGGSSRRQPLFESTRGLSPDLDDLRTMRPRLNFGDRILDAALGSGGQQRRGAGGDDGSNFGRGISPGQPRDDPFDDAFFQRRKLAPPRSADPDFMTEDPFKRRKELLFNTDEDDDALLSDFKKDTDSVVAGFRSRMKARKQREEESSSSALNDSFDSSAAESRVDRIRSRAKARLAELEDDLPNLSLNTSSSNRARAALRDLGDLDSSFSSNLGSSSSASKSLRITKRTVKATVETD